MKKLRNIAAAVAAAVICLTACESTTMGGATGSSRSQFMLISSGELNSSAAKSYNTTLYKAQASQKLNSNKTYAKRVKTISGRLIAQIGVFRTDASKWKWEVNVLESDEVNAYCMPGGKIAVYTGLIEKLNATDDELAAVIGHEIAHALREHSREQVSQQMATSTGISILSSLAGIGSLGNDIAQKAGELAITLPFSRKMESEADVMGLELMARAGYDPNAAVNVWKKMGALGGSSTPEILSTHPSDSSRIENLSLYIPRVQPLYDEAKRKKLPTVAIKDSVITKPQASNQSRSNQLRNRNYQQRRRVRYY